MSKIFLSYRRDGGEVMATMLYRELTYRNFSVFYDIESLKSGPFDTRLLGQIEECDDFIVILPKGGLDRCKNEGDWVRQEIAHAIKCGKNIIPVMLRGFEFPSDLPEDIKKIASYNGVSFEAMNLFGARMDLLVSYLGESDRAEGDTTESNNTNSTDVNKVKANFLPKEIASKKKNAKKLIKSIFNDICSISTKRESIIEHGVFKQYKGFKKYVSIPKEVILISGGAFSHYGSSKIRHIVIPPSITSLKAGAIFSGCYALRSVELPEGFVHIGEVSFNGCKSLKKVNIPESVNYIGECAFIDCASLTDISLPDKIDAINRACFRGCLSLRNINLPYGIEKIESDAFQGCHSLREISLPGSLKEIGSYAFSSCLTLSKIFFGGSKKEWCAITKGQNWDLRTDDYTVYCTDGEIKKCP